MVRLQIRLTEEKHRGLESIADREGVSVAEIIRRSVDTTLASESMPDVAEMKARARAVFGASQDSQPDVSGNHNGYMPEATRSP